MKRILVIDDEEWLREMVHIALAQKGYDVIEAENGAVGIEKARKQQLLIMVLLVIVSAVIIALIVYTLTMDKVRSIATLKFVGAPDRTIIGLIVQQALSMGIFGYFAGLALVLVFRPYFPRRLVLDPESVAIVFVITVVICLAASTLGIRLALKVDPAEALASSG